MYLYHGWRRDRPLLIIATLIGHGNHNHWLAVGFWILEKVCITPPKKRTCKEFSISIFQYFTGSPNWTRNILQVIEKLKTNIRAYFEKNQRYSNLASYMTQANSLISVITSLQSPLILKIKVKTILFPVFEGTIWIENRTKDKRFLVRCYCDGGNEAVAVMIDSFDTSGSRG